MKEILKIALALLTGVSIQAYAAEQMITCKIAMFDDQGVQMHSNNDYTQKFLFDADKNVLLKVTNHRGDFMDIDGGFVTKEAVGFKQKYVTVSVDRKTSRFTMIKNETNKIAAKGDCVLEKQVGF